MGLGPVAVSNSYIAQRTYCSELGGGQGVRRTEPNMGDGGRAAATSWAVERPLSCRAYPHVVEDHECEAALDLRHALQHALRGGLPAGLAEGAGGG